MAHEYTDAERKADRRNDIFAFLFIAVLAAVLVVAFLLQGLFGITLVMMAAVPVIYGILVLLTAGKL